jgi:alpha-tubulin suppressor-like RCC1 family protein
MSCAVYANGTLQCWGTDFGTGALGIVDYDPAILPSAHPAIDLGPGEHVSVAATSGYHTCAILTSGRLKCWGSNEFGQLGIGTTDTAIGDQSGEMGQYLKYTVID